MSVYLQLARPQQWIKNGFVFAGFLFYGDWHNTDLLLKSVWATAIFCLASSAVYAFNDIVDAEKDRQHPSKKNRPVALGLISKVGVFRFSISLAILAILGTLWISGLLAGFVAGYFVLNLAYTLHLKKIVILDVFCIALGFLLRMLAGTIAIGIPPSHWIILCTLMISLFLGFAKRSAELTLTPDTHRLSLSTYSLPLLHLFLGISAACTIMTYGLYTISDTTIRAHGTFLIYTLPLVLFGLFRYLYLVLSQGKGENPSRDVLEDRQILITLFLYVISILILGVF
jgi:4-hydroxybenzoate polyprenyltransferase